jgi:hypothetical protein
MKVIEIIQEAVADTQDVLQISKAIMDWMYNNNTIVPGSIIDVDLIPGLKATTPEGQTLINSTRIKIVDPSEFSEPTTRGDASPSYTDSSGKGIKGTDPYDDARFSNRVRKNPQGVDPDDLEAYKDFISSRGKQGQKMDIRLNADLINRPNGQKQIQSTLTHELGHHLDTIKGRDTIAVQRRVREADQAWLQIHHHNQAKRGEKIATDLNGVEILPRRAPKMLSPDEYKILLGIVKKAPYSQLPSSGNMAYWKDTAEINARLMQASEDMADFVPTILKNREKFGIDSTKIDDIIRYSLNKNYITVAFVDFASETEFQAALRGKLTDAEQRRAYANPEFKKLYNRMYKFLEAEMGPGGIMTQAAKTGFADWDKSIPASTASTEPLAATRAGFIERFKKTVIQGMAIVKNTARLALRYTRMGDVALTELLKKTMPVLFRKGLLKSVPVAGAVIGVAFSIPYLLKGDVPGAGIELVSGIGSLLTAIPATAYQAARDLYSEYYTYEESGKAAVLEYDLAQDPKGTEQRIQELSAKIAENLKAGIEQNRSILKSLPSTVEPNLGLI